MAYDPSNPKSVNMRPCPECGRLFVVKRADTVTCSPKCRSRRKRRQDKGVPEALLTAEAQAHLEEIRKVADEGAIAVAGEILREEIRPIVREALTADVLSAISDLVALTPLMVAGLKEELTGAPLRDPETGLPLKINGEPIIAVDADRRLKAIQLLARYTIGAPGLAPQPDVKERPIAISFGDIPRPDWYGTDQRECDICLQPRLEAEFVDGSSRCTHCQAELEAQAAALVEPAPAE
jgi:uncharacterized protein YciI